MIPITPETIEWIAVRHKLPDDDETVLIHQPGAREPIWLGWYVGEEDGWNYADASSVLADYPVTHWAIMPKGPSR